MSKTISEVIIPPKRIFFISGTKIVRNRAKSQISKRMLQENTARRILQKINISCSLIRTRACAYQGAKNVPISRSMSTEISGNLVVKSKLPPRSGSSLEAVETHP